MTSSTPLRVRRGEVQTPIWEFEHHETESQIGLVAVLHAGTQRYYDDVTNYALNSVIERGAEVLYERVRPMTDAEKWQFPTFTEAEQEAMLGLSRTELKYLDGVVAQGDGMHYREDWINADVSLAELLRLLGVDRARAIMDTTRRYDTHLDSLPPDRVRKALLMQYRLQPLLRIIAPIFQGPQAKHDKAVFVDHRNDVVLHAVDSGLALDSDQSMTLLQGPDHLPGIREGLEDRGYYLTSRYWLGALVVQPKPDTAAADRPWHG